MQQILTTAFLQNENVRNYIEEGIKSEKAVDFLVKNAKMKQDKEKGGAIFKIYSFFMTINLIQHLLYYEEREKKYVREKQFSTLCCRTNK